MSIDDSTEEELGIRPAKRQRTSRSHINGDGKPPKAALLESSVDPCGSREGLGLWSAGSDRSYAATLKSLFETVVLPVYSFFASMSSAMELGITNITRDNKENAETDAPQESEHSSQMSLAETASPIYSVAHQPQSAAAVNDANSFRIASDTDAFAFIASIPPLSSIMNRPQVCIPAKLASSPAYTLVLDLDETLVHCSTEELEKSDLTFPVFFRNVEYKVFVRRRPHLEQFLSSMSELFEIIVFTASHRVYADKLLDILDPENRYFTHRVFRDSCVFHVGNYVKDLSVLGRDLSRTVIIDNSPQAFGFHVDNGIPISTWTAEEEDDALLRLVPLLKDVANAADVRTVLREEIGLARSISEYKANVTAQPPRP